MLGKEVSIAQPPMPQVSSFNGAGGQELGKEAFQARSLLRKAAGEWVGDTPHSLSLSPALLNLPCFLLALHPRQLSLLQASLPFLFSAEMAPKSKKKGHPGREPKKVCGFRGVLPQENGGYLPLWAQGKPWDWPKGFSLPDISLCVCLICL